MRALPAVTLAAVGALALAGCGGSSHDASSSNASPSPVTSSPSSAASQKAARTTVACASNHASEGSVPANLAAAIRAAHVHPATVTAITARPHPGKQALDVAVTVCGTTDTGALLKMDASEIGRSIKVSDARTSVATLQVTNTSGKGSGAQVRCDDFPHARFVPEGAAMMRAWKTSDGA